jgi:hypothetical protein
MKIKHIRLTYISVRKCSQYRFRNKSIEEPDQKENYKLHILLSLVSLPVLLFNPMLALAGVALTGMLIVLQRRSAAVRI